VKPFDVIVVGIGAMGAAACHQLAARKARVLGLEQFDIPNSRGSSHGYSRMIRMAYYEHPNYVPLLRRAYALWDELQARSGRTILHRTGGLYAGPPDGQFLAGSTRAAVEHELPHELLDPAELQKRWPQFVVPEDWRALFEPAAGFLLPERGISTFAELALRDGAELHAMERVRQWSAESGRVVVRTDRDEYEAAQLIFAGGAWSEKLIGDLGVPLRVTRQIMGWVWPREPALFELGQIPVWGIDSLDGGIYYGFPMIPDAPGFKLAHHVPGPGVDAETFDRQTTAADENDFRPALRKHLPQADGPLLAMRACMYTLSPDQHFILDRHPRHPIVQIACGFSGHGFKFASVVGEILADRAVRGSTTQPIDFLGLNRFRLPAA
jgi:sarcosine oxidase